MVSRPWEVARGDAMTSRFEFISAGMPGLAIVRRRQIGDERGFIARMWCGDEFEAAGYGFTIAQINHTLTRRRGTVRGLHFQRQPAAETKLVSCLRGEVFDVAVDLRRDSPTFLAWHGEVLSADNQRSLLLPMGVAHGFQTLSDDCELLYLHSAAYAPDAEDGVNPRDPLVGIAWPSPIAEMSARDEGFPLLSPDFRGLAP